MARYDMDSANSENSEGTDKEQDDFPKPYLIQKKFDNHSEEANNSQKNAMQSRIEKEDAEFSKFISGSEDSYEQEREFSREQQKIDE